MLQNGDVKKVMQEHVSADVFIVVLPGRDFFEVIEQSLHEVCFKFRFVRIFG